MTAGRSALLDQPRRSPPDTQGHFAGPQHALEERVIIERRNARDDGNCIESLGDRVGASNRVGPAPRHADHREARQPEVVRQLQDVGRPIQQATTRLEVRAADPWAIDRDQPHARRGRTRDRQHCLEPRTRKAVEVQCRVPLRVAILRVGEPPTVWQDENSGVHGA